MVSIYLSQYKNFKNAHAEGILNYCKNLNSKRATQKLDRYILQYFGAIISSFEDLLKADPPTLERLKQKYDNYGPVERLEIDDKLDVTTLYKYFINAKEQFVLNNGVNYYSGYLASELGDMVCPYCNWTSIYQYQRSKSGDFRRSYEWDHVYPQSKYKFLAVSFFNLVPSCKVCNQTKSKEDSIIFSPHLDHNVDRLYTYDIDVSSGGFLDDSSLFKIDMIPHRTSSEALIRETEEVFSLVNRINAQKNMVLDIINRKRFRRAEYVKSVSKQMGIDEEQVDEVYFGIRMDHKLYFKRPYSKLTGDILKDKRI